MRRALGLVGVVGLWLAVLTTAQAETGIYPNPNYQRVGGIDAGVVKAGFVYAAGIDAGPVKADFLKFAGADGGTLLLESLGVRAQTVLGFGQDGGYVTADRPVLELGRGPGDSIYLCGGPFPWSLSSYDWCIGYYSGSLSPILWARGGTFHINNTSLVPLTSSSGNIGASSNHWATGYFDALTVGSGTGASVLAPIAAHCTTDGGVAAMVNGTDVRIDYSQCDVDTNSAVTKTPGSWTFTAPATRSYMVAPAVDIDYSAGTGGATCGSSTMSPGRIIFREWVNGVERTRFRDETWQAACDNRPFAATPDMVHLTAGDTLYITFLQASGQTRNLNASAKSNRIAIWSVGP